MLLQYTLPVDQLTERAIDWITVHMAGVFQAVASAGTKGMDGFTALIGFYPPLAVILLLTLWGWYISGRKWRLPLFTAVALLFIYNQGMWEPMLQTVTLIVFSGALSVLIGLPVGILCAKSDRAMAALKPILDFMQTMPSFVYLIPAVAFFGIGQIPGVFASVIFALPPTVRFTSLAIRQIDRELIETGEAFGCTPSQRLFKVELPLAKYTILAGINQTLMLALSMVVTASMIGAPGLGRLVLSALQKAQVGAGFVAGLSLVFLAILIDRFTQHLTAQKKMEEPQKTRSIEALAAHLHPVVRRLLAPALALLLIVIIPVVGMAGSGQASAKETLTLSYVQWDSEVASTHVLAAVLKQANIDVTLYPLDNAVNWQAVATGESDATVSAWLPLTHKEYYDKYKDKLTDVGVNFEGARNGLVVPTYMDVTSIEDLTDQANRNIIGIEPGAGIMTSADNTLAAYPNLKGWTVTPSSTGAMTSSLDQAIKNKKPVIVTGWAPHWMFEKYDLRMLEDPKGTMGKDEQIHTLAKKGLEKESPTAYGILSRFHWGEDDINAVMADISSGMSPEAAAEKFIHSHEELINSWIGD